MSIVPSVPLTGRDIGEMIRMGGPTDVTIRYEDGSEGVVTFGEPEIGLVRQSDGEFSVPLTLELWRHGVEHDDPDRHCLGLRQAIMDELDADRNGFGRVDMASAEAIAADLERIASELREWAKTQA